MYVYNIAVKFSIVNHFITILNYLAVCINCWWSKFNIEYNMSNTSYNISNTLSWINNISSIFQTIYIKKCNRQKWFRPFWLDKWWIGLKPRLDQSSPKISNRRLGSRLVWTSRPNLKIKFIICLVTNLYKGPSQIWQINDYYYQFKCFEKINRGTYLYEP